ncbi:prepilin-type N-terminal cleavage/methylation domain-containing protein [Butyricicoccus sp.]
MMEKMIALQQKRRSKKGGFTLVELIVVLVILAILAALLIPALTGYIDKAREKQVVAQARQCVMAAQTVYDEHYGKGATTDISAWNDDWNSEVTSLAEVPAGGSVSGIKVDGKNKISELTYKDSKNTCVYSGGEYTVNPKAVAKP